MKIRKLLKHEIDEAVDVACLAFDESDRKSAIKEFNWMFADDLYCPVILVAEENDALVGLVSFVRDTISCGMYVINWVCVVPQAQGRGIGKALVETALQYIHTEALQGKPGSVLLHAEKTVFYEKLGFTKGPESHRKNRYFMVKVFA